MAGLSRIERRSLVLRRLTARRQVDLQLTHTVAMCDSKSSKGIGIEGQPHALECCSRVVVDAPVSRPLDGPGPPNQLFSSPTPVPITSSRQYQRAG
jgi:hypothetical protein